MPGKFGGGLNAHKHTLLSLILPLYGATTVRCGAPRTSDPPLTFFYSSSTSFFSSSILLLLAAAAPLPLLYGPFICIPEGAGWASPETRADKGHRRSPSRRRVRHAPSARRRHDTCRRQPTPSPSRHTHLILLPPSS